MFEFIFALLRRIFLLGHLENGSFPKPLSEKEEAQLIERYISCDDEEAKNKLIEHNLRLVAHIVKKYAKDKDDADDLLSIGTIGLIKGIDTFTPNKNVRLSTYAAKCIHNEILMVLRSRRHAPCEVSLSEAVGSDKEGNEVTLMDIIPSEGGSVDELCETSAEIKKMYDGIKNVLQPRERMIVSLRYGLTGGKEMPQRELAKLLGISRSYVSRIEKKALEKLRDTMK